MAQTVDEIIADLIIRGIDKYEANFARATASVGQHTGALKALVEADRAADAALNRPKRTRSGADREVKTTTAAVKAASKERSDAEKAAGKAAADAVKAAEREKQAAIKATARERASAAQAAVKAAAAERTALAEVTAAIQREETAQARLAAVVARGAERAVITPGSGTRIGATVPREVTGQSSIPAGVLEGKTGAVAEISAQSEINHLLADRFDTQQRLRVATGEEARDLSLQLEYLRRIDSYREAGLTDELALTRAEREIAAIEAQRVRIAAEQAALVEKQVRAQAGKTANRLTLLAPTIVGGIGVHEVSALNDSYIQLTNTLHVAGVSAQDFDTVQSHLLATANRSGTDINSLADVYRGAALASKDLGASQSDLLKVTDAAANALRITGRSSEDARGALLQLSHAFESGRVTAREFNGLALNLYPILQAVAKGSDEYGGSVAKLRQALLDGDISSKVFFQDLIKGSDDLAARASVATLTTAQGFNALRNSLIVYFGEADKSQGVSAALGIALQTLANNLDTLIPAIVAVGTALAVGYVARLATAAAATQGLGSVIASAFGGPIGLSITAITLAVGSFAVEANRTAYLVHQANEAYSEMKDRLAAASVQAGAAGSGVKGVGNDALGAIPKVRAFAGAVGDLAQQLYNQARAARVARIETLQKQLQDSQSNETKLAQATPAGRNDAANLTRGDFLNNAGALGRAFTGNVRNFLSGGRTDRETLDAYRKQAAVSVDLQRQLDAAKKSPIAATDIPGGIPVGNNQNAARITKLQSQVADLEKLKASASGRELATINRAISKREKQIGYLEKGVSNAAAVAASAGGGGGRAGPSADTLARREEAARLKSLHDDEGYTSALRQARDQELQAQIDLTNDTAKRADLERERVRDAADELAKNIRAKGPKDARANGGVSGTGERTAGETGALLDINADTAKFHLDAIDLGERRRALDEADSLDRDARDAKKADLQAQLQLTDTTRDRRTLALQLLDLEYQQRQADIAAILNPDSNATKNERDIATVERNRLAAEKQRDEKGINRQYEGSGASYLRGLNVDQGEFIQGEQVKLLEDFNSGLDDSVKKALHLHGIFGDIIGDLIDMAIKQALLKPIANALFGGGDATSGGGGGSSFISGILSAIGIGGSGGGGLSYASAGSAAADAASAVIRVPGFASGGRPPVGKLSVVGERGPELFVPDAAGTIVPNHAINVVPSNMRVTAAPAQQNIVVLQPITADFRGARTDEQTMKAFTAYADATSKQAYAAAVKTAAGQAPGVIQRQQTLGS